MSNKHGSKWITQQKRLAIYLRDGMCCCYCGATLEDGITLSLDHIIPRNYGGDNKESNLITACKSCNEIRQDRDVAEYIKLRIAFYGLNVTFETMLDHINGRLSVNLKPFVEQSKEIINNRPVWADSLKYASQER